MQLESIILSKTQQKYKELMAHPEKIQNIRRNTPISDFSPDEISVLDDLLNDHYINLLLNITFTNLLNHTDIKIEDSTTYSNIIKQNPSNFSVSKITFNNIDAFIWVGLYFNEEVDKLIEDTFSPNHIDKLKQIFFSILAIIGIFLCGYLLSLPFIFSSTLYIFLSLVIGWLSGHYLWNTYIPKSRKMTEAIQTERKFLVQEYLSTHLNIFASEYLKLDDE